MPSSYPATVAECLSDRVTYKPEVLAALRRFRAARPWRGDVRQRRRKIAALHEELCRAYGRQTRLGWGPDGGDSGQSCYLPHIDRIVLIGRVSVVTYLHEFAHAQFGPSERKACRWSLNLFRRMFPRSWSRLRFEGHVVRRSS